MCCNREEPGVPSGEPCANLRVVIVDLCQVVREQVVDTRNGTAEPLVMGVVDHTVPFLVSPLGEEAIINDRKSAPMRLVSNA